MFTNIWKHWILVVSLLINCEYAASQKNEISPIVKIPPGWNPECPFYNENALKTMVDEYLQQNGQVCDKLGLCPKMPEWAQNQEWGNLETTKVDYFTQIPQFKPEEPLHIFIKFYMENISSVILSEMTFRIDYHVQMQWYLPINTCKVYYDKLLEKNLRIDPNNTEIDVNSRFFSLFWLPDIFITNSFLSIRQSEPIDTRSITLNIGNKDSETNAHCFITYSSRNADTIFCPMNFHLYPFDEQSCEFKFRSFSYTSKQMLLHWEEVDWFRELSLPGYQFQIQKNRSVVQQFRTDEFSVLTAELSLSRQITSLLIGSYFPTFLIILITISTFWLGFHVIADRLNTGIISVLAIYDQYNASRKQLPAIGYITPIGYWMVVSMLLVFLQLFQNAIYYFFLYRERMKGRSNAIKNVHGQQEQDITWENYLDPFAFATFNSLQNKSKIINDSRIRTVASDQDKPFLGIFTRVPVDQSCSEYKALKFNAYARVIFCASIVLFLFIYWPYVVTKGYIYNYNH